MIPARKSRWIARWFAGHAERRFRARFQHVHIHGLGRLRAALDAGPVLLVSNHASWWDALLAVWFGHRVLGCDGYAMMDADNLRRFPFFARVGGFGVERGRRDRAALRYTAELLDRPGRMVWIFPQGEERPETLRPLGFHGGAALVARAAGAPVVPMALRYAAGADEGFELWLSVGEPLERPDVATMEGAVEAELDCIDAHLCATRPMPVEALLSRRRSWLQRAAERLLSLLVGRARRRGAPSS